MINHPYKCIFVHVPKVAGTSMLWAFGQTWKNKDAGYLTSGCASPVKWKLWTKHRHKFKQYFLFSVVRNPWDRFISGWKYCVSTKNRTLTDVLRNLPQKKTPENDRNNHDYMHLTVTQYECLYDNDTLIVDFLMRYENLQADFDKVCDRIGKPRIKLERKNTTTHTHYRDYFTEPEQLELFEKHYGIDIKTFGYTF